MRIYLSLSQFLQLSLIVIPLGASEKTITFPWVGYGDDYFHGYEGRVVGSSGDKTSYTINCPPTATSCYKFSTPMTFVLQPNAYHIEWDQGYSYTSSWCSFTGSPTPTTAACFYSQSYELRSTTVTRELSYNVPGPSVYYVIHTASMIVGGSDAPTSTGTRTATTSSSASEVSGIGTSDMTSKVPSSSTDAAPTTTSVPLTTTPAAPTTTSGNLAPQTPAPLILVGGLLAGALLL
ncbi:hypothetical protein N7517_003918 [Penicillium concentricum]|uniref:Uncharacterized protein n=1 Tax=Penicillium concentricum TaxID=293559 RepID=A0A9W9S581_9EURO|nr:uncharacterized protein N7517_003918 [Penicillium concentricum]KAJ5371912.1 hypothetical protein N7517_003918 [Penicillium concentricum]